MKKNYKTEQEEFWAGDFGNEYISRNSNKSLIIANINIFSKIIEKTKNVKSIIEFGANIGNNIDALKILLPNCKLSAVEINEKAAEVLKAKISGGGEVYNKSILDFNDEKSDLVFTSGVLIHINPDELQKVYESIYNTSNKYILVMEYYNPTPVEIKYHGADGKLFKRDFAGDIMDKYSDLTLIDYGFTYHRDNNFNFDDITWFLLEKDNAV